MIQHVARFLPRPWLCLLAAFALPAAAQVYQTQALYSNPVSSRSTTNNAFATPVSGSTFTATNRPTELNTARFKIDNFQAGAPFSSAPPDFNFGDVIPPPPLTDLSKTPTIVTRNGAFYMASRKQLIAAQGGACTIQWPTLNGATNSITYNIGSVPVLNASRLFWTDNYVTGAALNTNTTSLPDNTDYAVSLSGIYAKIHYNLAVADFDSTNSQNTAAGRYARSDNAIAHQDLPAVWIDRNSVLRARNQSGYLIVEYFDTSSYDNSVGYEIVYAGPAKVFQSSLVLGDRLMPSEGAAIAEKLTPSISKAGDYIVQWSASGSHFYNWIFAAHVNSDANHVTGDSSKTQILWQKQGNLQVVWPYEPHWYSITWPGDDVAKVFVFDPADPSHSPTVAIPTNFTATVVWSESSDQIVKSDSSDSVLRPVGEGRALIQYQNNTDVWFVPVRVAARSNGAYFSNEETYWPVGLPLQPVVNQPRLQFNGVDNYLTFEAALHGGVSLEMWIRPNALTNNQSLAAFMDYPQQAGVQVMLSLTNGFLQLAVLTNGTATVAKLVSAAAITANAWSHVAFTKNSSGVLKLYVNGVLDNGLSVPKFNAQPPGSSTYAQMLFGKSFTVGGAVVAPLSAFSGEIREIRMWDSELTEKNLRKQMSLQLTGSEDTLAHLITPAWQESYTPAEGSDGSFFLTPDHVTGELVEGFGVANTAGLAPYPLVNRLKFNGVDNWADFPMTWNRADLRTIEFWFTPSRLNGNHSVMAIGSTTATNLQVGINGNAKISLYAGSNVAPGAVLEQDVSYHVAVVTSGDAAALYLDGVFQGAIGLPAATVIGTQVFIGTGSTQSNPKLFEGEIQDLRVYAVALSETQIANDRISSPDFTDPDLIRYFDLDQISPATVSGQAVFQFPDEARGYTATYHGATTFGSSIPGRVLPEVAGASVRFGSAYHLGIYTNESRVIPVNSTPGNSSIEVWWPDTFSASYLSQPLAFPSIVSRYRLMDPLAPPVLAIAGQNVSGYPIPTTWADPTVYYQNNSTLAGYNPNEEHALLVGSSLYALRWDLNHDDTSHGYALLQYRDENRGSLSYLQPIQIIPTNSTYPNFDKTFAVGQLLQAPKPMTDLPASSLSGPLSGADPRHRLYKDRENYWWVRSAASSGPTDFVVSRWYYPLQNSFYWPGSLGAKAPGDSVPFGNTSNALAINYYVVWPTVVPHLALGQSLTDAIQSASGGDGYLPAVTGQKSAEILFDEANEAGKFSSVIIDPTRPSSADLANLNNLNTATDVQLGKTYFTLLPPHLRERVYWDPQTKKLNLTGSIVRPVTGAPYLLPAWLGPSGNPNTDFSVLANLSSDAAWQNAVNVLRKNANVIPDAETAFDSIALTPTGSSGGYVTLGMNTRQEFNQTGDPISLYPIFIDTNSLFSGQVLVLFSANKFDEYTTLRHSGDFGGDPSLYQFDWRYSGADHGQAPTSSPSNWVSYVSITTGLNRIIFGGPGLLTLKDTYFSVRWRCVSTGAPNTNWCAWTPPALVESWLTRALDGINPFEQRVDSLANNHVDLTTSILSQAGKRFIGAVPLNMDNVNDYGLIEIYETLLDRARNLSIDSGYSDDDVNASLLDAASKLNELYTTLGDEAFNDSKDPTVAWGTRDLNDVFFGSRASSLFAFQGIVPNLLEEELALLRGLDDSTSTPVTTHPVYNRLYWNFTKGINSGEPAYALNYGIQSVTTNNVGSISEADAAKWYPQGHGDAYGHYLTALTTYYHLLMNTNFTWYPRAEVKVIGGVNVTFDYVDERKMAVAALQRARAGSEIIERTFRRDFRLDPTQRRPLFEDATPNRGWSASEWCDRVSQGVLYDWIVLNSLLPTPMTGDDVQTVNRVTVPELMQLASMSGTIQDTSDAIDRGDSPMQVAANVVPFDLDPTLIDAGVSHFEQIYARAVSSMQAAYAVLQRANASAANLRRQNVSLETFREQVAQREAEFNSQLVDLYGSPYADDIGATGTFKSGYNGPDLYHFNYIDRDLFSPADAGAVTNVSFHAQYTITGDEMDTLSPIGTNISYYISMDGLPVLPNSWTGRRSIYGKIQGSLADYIRAWVTLRGAVANQTHLSQELEARLQRLRDHNAFSASYGAIGDNLSSQKQAADLLQELSDNIVAFLDEEKEAAKEVADASSDATPQSFIAGLAAGGDLSFPARLGIGLGKIASFVGFTSAQGIANLSSYAAGKTSTMLDDQIAANDDALAGAEYQSQTTLETTILLSRANAARDSIYAAAIAFRQAWQNYQSLVSKGNQLQTDLLAFRTANASRIQESRYADVVFRVFRNEDLENYRNAFDQAARYAFAAARVYDYETGLLDPYVVAGRSGDFMGEVMTARQLGDMVNGQPVPGSANASSLASVLDRMRANWATLKGRFGINNPTRETHNISLRQELFRIGNSTNAAAQDANETAWKNQLYALKISDLRQLPEFKNFCQLYSPMASSEPAIVIPFSTEISAGKNVFGLPLAGGDTVFDPAHFTTKIRGATVALLNYDQNAGASLTRTPRVYLVPVGIDRQRTPLSGGTEIRDWHVIDQVWPIPYPSAAGNVNIPLESIGSDNMHVIRKFAPMRAYDAASLTGLPRAPYDTRLVGRSVWNTRWVLIIPASSLSSSTATALDTFIESVGDIKLLLETYSYSGN